MNYTKVTSEALDAIISLFENYISDDDTWISSHISIAFDDVETAMTIKIWDMDEQEYNHFKRRVAK